MLDLGLGLYADSIFGLIAVVNSYIGIRQELKAKATLDELAVLVAPHARVRPRRQGRRAAGDEVVPGDVIAVGPGDQLVADGEVIASRGLTLDESLLTGEADGIHKDRGDAASSPAPSASPAPATTSSTRCASRATPAASPARRKRSATRPRRCRRRSTG